MSYTLIPLDAFRDHRGKLAAFTSVGSYPVVYFTSDWDALCADCADAPEECEYPAVTGEVYYEGAPEICVECNKPMPSAYGDPENED